MPSATTESFGEIYADFGPGEALSADSSSLSYLYALNEDVWVLMLDSNTDHDFCGLFPDSLHWDDRALSRAKEAGVPVISSMGTGNKLDGSAFRITTIEKTKVCPLAKVMRRELKKRGIEGVKVLYSEEEPKSTGGSISFVPSVAGLLIAGEVVRELLDREGK